MESNDDETDEDVDHEEGNYDDVDEIVDGDERTVVVDRASVRRVRVDGHVQQPDTANDHHKIVSNFQ